MNHLLEAAVRVSTVLSGQAAILFIDQFQLSQTFMHLSLESLKQIKKKKKDTIRFLITEIRIYIRKSLYFDPTSTL